MRVLFVSAPSLGHLFPMIPLAWALRAAGHRVLVATTGPALAAASAGLPVADIAPGVDMGEVFTKVIERHPHLMQTQRTSLHDFRDVAMLFGALNAVLADGLVELAESWRPDVVVYEVLATAGAVAAARLGVPAVQHDIAFTSTTGLHEAIVETLDDVLERHRVRGRPEYAAVITIAPPSMVTDHGRGWPMRYLPYNGGGVLPSWLLRPPDLPRVVVTLGTVSPTMFGLGPVPRILQVAEEVDVEFMLALGDTELDGLGPLPPNVRTVGWLPLSELLPHCSAMIHHGGSGTVYNGLVAGVPQLLLPDGADRALNADAVYARGIGLKARAEDVDAALVRRLLTDQAIKDATAEVRAEIAGLPAPDTLVPLLVGLAG